MGIKQYEYTSSAEVKNQLDEQVNEMRQGDMNQQKMANNQLWLKNLFGDPELKKSRAIETIIGDSVKLEKEEGEDQFDYEIRKQKHVLTQAAAVDPEVAIQANQNIIELMKDKRAQARLTEMDSQEKKKFDWSMKKNEMEQTPTIEQYNPSNGQWESIATGTYGEDTFDTYKVRVDELNQEGGQYRMSKESAKWDIEDFEASETGIDLGRTLKRESIEGLQAISNTMASFDPLVNLLEQDNFALQGIEFDKHGQLLKGESNTFFGSLQDLGEQVRSTLDPFDRQYMTNDDGRVVDVVDTVRDLVTNPEVAEQLKSRGISAGVAQGIIIDVGYALAKMRDDGRLSDQDVSLAIRSLTGRGSVAEIGELLNVQVNKARQRLKDLKDLVSESPGVVPKKVMEAAEQAVLNGQDLVVRMRKQAEKQNQPTGQTDKGGLTDADRAALDNEYDWGTE